MSLGRSLISACASILSSHKQVQKFILLKTQVFWDMISCRLVNFSDVSEDKAVTIFRYYLNHECRLHFPKICQSTQRHTQHDLGPPQDLWEKHKSGIFLSWCYDLQPSLQTILKFQYSEMCCTLQRRKSSWHGDIHDFYDNGVMCVLCGTNCIFEYNSG